MGIIAPIIYAVLKKQQKTTSIIIEKHVKLKESLGPDAATSIDTDQLKELIDHINLIRNTKLN
jgi:sialic acid synthase SpsE